MQTPAIQEMIESAREPIENHIMKTAAIFTLTLLAGALLHADEPAKSIQLNVGMNYANALNLLKENGAKPFACSYKSAGTYCWYTLKNSMTIHIRSDKKPQNDEQLVVSSLRLCNSTMFFCRKGELWYEVDSIRLSDDVLSLGKLSVWAEDEEKPHEVTAHFFKGMSSTVAQKMLEKAGIKPLPVDDSWLAKMPEGGSWARYPFKFDNDDCEIILNFGNKKADADPVIRTMLVEATKPQEKDRKAARYRVECEFLDLNKPIRKEWYWAFGEEWSWKPGKNDQSDFMKAAGQRR